MKRFTKDWHACHYRTSNLKSCETKVSKLKNLIKFLLLGKAQFLNLYLFSFIKENIYIYIYKVVLFFVSCQRMCIF